MVLSGKLSLEKLKQSHGVTVRWRSFELRPPGSPPMPAEYRARIEAGRPRLYQMAREHYGLELNAGQLVANSRPALVGAKYAEQQGAGDAYHAAVFGAFWQEAKDISDRVVLGDIAEAVGLERVAFLQAIEFPVYQAAVQADVNQASAYGLHAVPALIFDEKYLVSGAQPYDVLRQVVERVLQERQ